MAVRPSPRRAGSAPSSGARQRVSHRLVALGAAAVVAVYAAGFWKTKAAAERLSNDELHRRPPAPSPPEAGPVAEMPAPPALAAAAEPTAATRPSSTSAPASGQSGTAARRARRRAVTPEPAAATSEPAAAVPTATTAPKAETTPTPTPAATVAAAATEVKPVEPEPAPKPQAAYKDGTYYGWGTSRHGDIQAVVVIHDGRITSASISQCLTRYSCSWIAALPPQVVSRQSPEVDFVSGATQSTNAFYYAVIEALSKAK